MGTKWVLQVVAFGLSRCIYVYKLRLLWNEYPIQSVHTWKLTVKYYQKKLYEPVFFSSKQSFTKADIVAIIIIHILSLAVEATKISKHHQTNMNIGNIVEISYMISLSYSKLSTNTSEDFLSSTAVLVVITQEQRINVNL